MLELFVQLDAHYCFYFSVEIHGANGAILRGLKDVSKFVLQSGD